VKTAIFDDYAAAPGTQLNEISVASALWGTDALSGLDGSVLHAMLQLDDQLPDLNDESTTLDAWFRRLERVNPGLAIDAAGSYTADGPLKAVGIRFYKDGPFHTMVPQVVNGVWMNVPQTFNEPNETSDTAWTLTNTISVGPDVPIPVFTHFAYGGDHTGDVDWFQVIVGGPYAPPYNAAHVTLTRVNPASTGPLLEDGAQLALDLYTFPDQKPVSVDPPPGAGGKIADRQISGDIVWNPDALGFWIKVSRSTASPGPVYFGYYGLKVEYFQSP
jgi:hypothetical protein